MKTFTLKNGEEICYRRLGKGDEKALNRFNDELSENSRNLFSPHGYDKKTISKAIKRSKIDKDRVYIALDEDRIIAYFFLWWYDTQFPVLGIGIADDFQGQGLGRKIMERLIEDAKAGDCSGIELTTALNNEHARALYEKVGFRIIGKVENLTGDGRTETEWHMFYPIKPGATPPPRKHAAPI